MSILVIDSSVAAKWDFAEIHSDAAKRALSSAHELHAPDFILFEMDSIILKHARRGAINLMEAKEFRDSFRRKPIRTHPSLSLLDAADGLAAETQCGVYDCLYLAYAIALNGQMATADKRSYNILTGSSYQRHVLWVEDIP